MSRAVRDYKGREFRSLSELAREYNVNRSTLENRLRRNGDLIEFTRQLDEQSNTTVKLSSKLLESYGAINSLVSETLSYFIMATNDISTEMTEETVVDHKGNIFSSDKDMSAYWGINYDMYLKRIKLGWSTEQALTISENIDMCLYSGIVFSGLSELCDICKLPYYRIKARVASGWSLEKAVDKENIDKTLWRNSIQIVKDHKGNEYASESTMYKVYGVDKELYYSRKSDGWCLEYCLTSPFIVEDLTGSGEEVRKNISEYKGTIYKTFEQIEKDFGVCFMTARNRLSRGWSIEKTINLQPIGSVMYSTGYNADKGVYVDHEGNEFDTKAEICDYWHISINIFDRRVKNGWGIKDVLTFSNDVKYIYGNIDYGNLDNLCLMLNIENRQTIEERLALGWTVQKAVDTPVIKEDYKLSTRCVDHKGNIFDSLSQMCKDYGITMGKFSGRRKLGWSLKDTLVTK